jgi:outer membrane protein OmpA-like peptidoglycan-associated protein
MSYRSLAVVSCALGVAALAGWSNWSSSPAATEAPPTVAAWRYNVYFNSDTSELTPEAISIVDHVAVRVKQDGGRVTIAGEANAAGTDPEDKSLSRRRADAVRQALCLAGVPGERIEEQWIDNREPPVPAASGVREPRDRAVAISFP